jgi:hypothetical protein
MAKHQENTRKPALRFTRTEKLLFLVVLLQLGMLFIEITKK